MKKLNRRQFLTMIGSTALAGSLFHGAGAVHALQRSETNPRLLIDPAVLVDRLDKDAFRILDIRNDEKYLSGHLPEAIQLWFPEVTVNLNGVPGFVAPPETVAEAMSTRGIDADTEVIVYGDTGAIWAARMFWVLEYHGHTNARILDGGFPFWNDSFLPLALGRVEAEAKTFQPEVQSQKRVDADWVLDHLDDPGVVFVDARETDTYNQGHIPGAISKPWLDNIDWDTERFKAFDVLEQRFTESGIVKDRTVISYCQTGVLSAQNFFTFRLLGYPDVRLYDGSFADWSSNPDRPIESG